METERTRTASISLIFCDLGKHDVLAVVLLRIGDVVGQACGRCLYDYAREASRAEDAFKGTFGEKPITGSINIIPNISLGLGEGQVSSVKGVVNNAIAGADAGRLTPVFTNCPKCAAPLPPVGGPAHYCENL